MLFIPFIYKHIYVRLDTLFIFFLLLYEIRLYLAFIFFLNCISLKNMYDWIWCINVHKRLQYNELRGFANNKLKWLCRLVIFAKCQIILLANYIIWSLAPARIVSLILSISLTCLNDTTYLCGTCTLLTNALRYYAYVIQHYCACAKKSLSVYPTDLMVTTTRCEIRAGHGRHRVGIRHGENSGHKSRIRGVRRAGNERLGREGMALARRCSG